MWLLNSSMFQRPEKYDRKLWHLNKFDKFTLLDKYQMEMTKLNLERAGKLSIPTSTMIDFVRIVCYCV